MSTATAIPAPTAVYREEQWFGWWTYALLAVMVALASVFLLNRRQGVDAVGGVSSSLAITVGFALPAVFVVGVLRMTTEVTASCVDVWFGWLPTYRRRVAISSIQSLEVVTYQPWTHCRGWGIRTAVDGERVLSARGDRGVRLTLTDGTRLLIGSQTAEALASSIERGIRPIG